MNGTHSAHGSCVLLTSTCAFLPPKRRFNRALSGSRSSVEGVFGVLKARWGCILKRIDSSLENVSRAVITCCILHNICESNNDFDIDEDSVPGEIIGREREVRMRRR